MVFTKKPLQEFALAQHVLYLRDHGFSSRCRTQPALPDPCATDPIIRNGEARVQNSRCCLYILCYICLYCYLRLSLSFGSPLASYNQRTAESCSSRCRSNSYIDQKLRPKFYYTSDINHNEDVKLIMNLSLSLRWQLVPVRHPD